jgi:phosphoglycolate phosphatase
LEALVESNFISGRGAMMAYNVDTIIFDFDGVLVDTGPDIANAANFTLRQFHLAELPKEIVIGYIGGGAEMLMRRCLKEQADALLSQALPIFNQRYNEYCCVDTCLYPGVKSVLEQYKKIGKRMGIATQKKETFTHIILSQLDIEAYFEVIVGPDSVTHRKPHPESVLHILEKTEARAERAVVVGDMPTDIQAGKAAGTLTCGVCYGYGSREEILAAQPDVTIDTLVEMLDWIQ